jgi:hypothetical protein
VVVKLVAELGSVLGLLALLLLNILGVFVMQAHLGKQKTVCWYYPPEIDYRLSLLPENSKGLVLWLIEARVSHHNKVKCWVQIHAIRFQ